MADAVISEITLLLGGARHVSNPTLFSWTDPTENVDGSPIAAGEITGYLLGIRQTTAPGSAVGTYPITAQVAGAAAASELLSALGTVLTAGSYAAAVRAVGPVNSSWSTEAAFTIVPPTPSPPTNFTVA
jgi:hypothetical protein